MYSSDLRRASETAAEVARAQGLQVVAYPELREVDVGSWSRPHTRRGRGAFPGRIRPVARRLSRLGRRRELRGDDRPRARHDSRTSPALTRTAGCSWSRTAARSGRSTRRRCVSMCTHIAGYGPSSRTRASPPSVTSRARSPELCAATEIDALIEREPSPAERLAAGGARTAATRRGSRRAAVTIVALRVRRFRWHAERSYSVSSPPSWRRPQGRAALADEHGRHRRLDPRATDVCCWYGDHPAQS